MAVKNSEVHKICEYWSPVIHALQTVVNQTCRIIDTKLAETS